MAGTTPDPLNNIPVIGACKPKKEEKSYWFDLKLCESNEEIYPEFSWLELIAAKKGKLAKERLSAGQTLLDPYASGDEDDLKAMAARLEAKYGNGKPTKSVKRKRQAEDYIDRGAGYDESDSFIDNSDVYDEVVPADLETVRGGFYINQGSLDFREVEMSDEEHIEENSNKQEKVVSSVPVSTPSSIITAPASMPKQKRPKLIVSRKHSSLQSKIKAKDSIKSKAIANVMKSKAFAAKADSNNSKVSSISQIVRDSSSSESSTSGSSSSEETTSSSDSSSSGEEDEDNDKKSVKQVQKSAFQSTSVPDNGIPPVKRLKTKNVPPNPALAKNKIITSTPLSVVSSTKEIIVTTPIPSSKVLTQTGQNISPITSNLGLTITSSIPPSTLKVPTPKSTPTSSSSATALNLVRSNKLPKSSKQHQHPNPKKVNIPLMAAQFGQAAAADLMLNHLASGTSITASHNVPSGSKLKSKPKVKNVSTSKIGPKPKQSSMSSMPSNPPKLKAKPKLNPLSTSTMHATNLSQSMSPFGRINQTPPLSAQTIEITKIKPGHLSASSSSSISSSMKSLSNLGSGITVTEVKDKPNSQHSSHTTSSSISGISAVTVNSSNHHSTVTNSRSRSPSGVTSSCSTPMGSGRKSQSLTITPSTLLNLSASGSVNSGNMGNSVGNPGSITLANINMMPPSSRSSNNSIFGQSSGNSAKKSITPFNVNNILSHNDFVTPTTSSSGVAKAEYLDPLSLAIAYNSFLQKK